MKSKIGLALPVCGLSCCTLFAEEPLQKQMLFNGNFEHLDSRGRPEAWRLIHKDKVTTAKDKDNRVLRLTNHDPLKSATAHTVLKLEDGTDKVLVKGRVNVKSVTPGKANWHDVRITLNFKDKNNKPVSNYAINWKKTTNGWVDFTKEIKVPEGAVSMTLSPSIFVCTAEVDFDDIKAYFIKKK